ncbi:LPS-assembly protein LptD [Iodidimonas gelatinilytica]|uniref:LPS-assembly protein LptD n=1 Tax=Iodidimonas gelatinilytica TaxID=1236966 RepID=A0A5A7MM24_9PROT|nr:LPS-assembly protein LptD [Iodidimonas gelatinilytica]
MPFMRTTLYAALLCSAAPQALSQTVPDTQGLVETPLADRPEQKQTTAAPILNERDVVFSADQSSIDPETSEIIARGNVVVIHDGYRLEAGLLRYNDKTGIAQAEGGVRITNPDGMILKASSVRLSGALRAGVIENARLILTDGSRVAANRGERFEDGNSELRDAVFSPCPVCDTDPDKQPLWQIKALKVVHNKKERRLYYESAFFEILGVPVFWLPYLSHPDPTVERDSGLLVPEIKSRQELGVVVELPYHIALSPSRDLTITPILTTKESPVLGVKYRQHFGSGYFDMDGSISHGDQPSEAVTGIDDNGFRGHFFSKGRFVHNDHWQSTYNAQIVSDDTFLRLYDFSDADTLTSNYQLEGFFDRSYISGELIGFRGLRLEDEGGLTAQALPWIDMHYVSPPGFLGGTVEAQFNSIQLVRFDGADTARASTSLQWQAPVITPMGQKITFDAFARTDLYDTSQASRTDDPLFAGESGTETRALGRVSATMSWPFASHQGGVSQTIEPIIQLAAIPESGRSTAIPNEDSRTIELTAHNLFSLNRAPGFDVWEGGSRASYGLKYSLDMSDIALAAVAGQSYRSTDLTEILPEGTGLGSKRSDYVGAVDLSIQNWINLSYQFQLDKSSFDPRRHEIVSTIGTDVFRVNLGYLRIDRDLEIAERTNREEIRFDATFQATENWRIFGGLIHGLGKDSQPIEYETGVLYENECMELGINVRKRFTEDRDIQSGTSVGLRIRLRSLG